MKKQKKVLIITTFLLFNFAFLTIGAIGGFYLYQGYEESQLQQENINSAVAPEPTPIVMDLSSPSTIGSPLVFGGAHNPPLDHEDAWDLLQEVGVTSLRTDFYLEFSMPEGITLEQYKENEELQNPDNWSQSYIENRREIFRKAQEHGMQTIGIVSFAPKWLTHSGTVYGVPKDWDVYEDIVKKHYRLYRDHVDYLEIWNEPNLPEDDAFLDVSETELSKSEAYELIYYHAARAIRAVDLEINDGKTTPLGGPVSASPVDSSFLKPLLTNPETAALLDFVSYHQYETKPFKQNTNYTNIIDSYSTKTLPIFITEWNYSWKNGEMENIATTARGITYTSNMIINYLKDGITGANFHTLTPLMDGKPYGISKNHAFYQWNSSEAEPLFLTRTWQLLSKTLGLGNGSSNVIPLTTPEDMEGIGFTNSAGINGIVLVNSTDEKRFVELSINSLPETEEWKKAYLYTASEQTDGKTLLGTQVLRQEEGVMSVKLYIEPQTVSGLLLRDNVTFYEQVKYRLMNR
ncbi:MAG: GH39 family glycosyl hydrolase [Patescibacteria group bacterium]